MSSYLGAFLTVFPKALTTNISDNTSANSKIISSIFLNKPKTSVLGFRFSVSVGQVEVINKHEEALMQKFIETSSWLWVSFTMSCVYITNTYSGCVKYYLYQLI